jgi:hypothetical protein
MSEMAFNALPFSERGTGIPHLALLIGSRKTER